MAAIVANTGSNNWNTNGAWVGGVQPTAADDVTIPATAVVTIPTATTVLGRSVTIAASATVAWASTTAILAIGDGTAGAGNVALSISSSATITLTGIGTIQFISSSSTQQTITSGGKTLPNITFAGTTTSSYIYSDALTSSGNHTFAAGNLDLNSFTHSVSTFTVSGGNAKVITWGTAIVNATLFGGTPVTASGATNVTITATVGAQLNASNGNGPGINLGSVNWGNVAVAHTNASVMTVVLASSGATVYSYTRTPTASKLEVVSFTSGGSMTVTNSLSLNGNSTINRLLVQAGTQGSAFTITNNGSYSLSNVDFQDIAFAGSASTNFSAITGLSGDCGGNSGATFTTGITNYWVPSGGTSTGSWSTTTRWSTSSGGTAGTGRVPLPQDDATFDANSIDAGSRIITADMPRCCKNLSWTGATNTPNMTWTTALAQTFYGNVTFISAMNFTFGNTVNWNMSGRGSHTFDSAGKTFTGTNMITGINSAGGTYTLASAYTTGHSISIISGTFDTGNYSVTSSTLASAGALTRTITAGTSTWSLTQTSATVFSISGSGYTFNGESSTFTISTTSASNRTIVGSSVRIGTFTYTLASSTGSLIIQGSNSFLNFNFSDVTNARTMTLTSNTLTTIRVLNTQGTAGKLMSIVSSTGGTAAYLELVEAPSTVDYLSIQDIFSTTPYKFYAGANSTSVSGNTNIILTAPVTGPSIYKQVEASAVGSVTATFPFSRTATAGNLLIVTYSSSATPGSVTTPTGYTLIDSTIQGTTAYLYTFYKVAVGGETSALVTTSSSPSCVAKLVEVGGFTGTPTLDVISENSNAAATALSTDSGGTGPTNTDNPAYAFAAWSAAGTMGATVSFSNTFHESRSVTQQTISRYAGKLLTSNAAVITTNTWTTSRAAVSQLLVFKSVSASASRRMLTGMGQ